MTSAVRLVRIESRRSLGLWLLLPMIALGWYAAARGVYPSPSRVVTLWIDVDAGVRNSVVFVGPIAAALAAWTAGRNRRRRLEDLLASTSRPAIHREMAIFAGAAFWPVLGYMVVAFIFMGFAFSHGSWGGPGAVTLLVGLTSVTAMAAVGFAVGSVIRSRFVAPLVAVAFLGALIGLSQGYATYNYLTPVDFSIISVFRAAPGSQGVPQILWLLGLGLTAMAGVGVLRQRSLVGWGALGLGVIMAGLGAGLVLSGASAPLSKRSFVTYHPVCVVGGVQVCVHPAYEKLLPGAANVMEKVTAPVEGLSGAPSRLEQRGITAHLYVVQPDGTMYFELDNVQMNYDREGFDYLASELAQGLVTDPEAMKDATGQNYWTLTSSQKVVATWLMEQAGFLRRPPGISPHIPIGLATSPEEKAALSRFEALAPAVRHQWLVRHFASLRAGTLKLENMP